MILQSGEAVFVYDVRVSYFRICPIDLISYGNLQFGPQQGQRLAANMSSVGRSLPRSRFMRKGQKYNVALRDVKDYRMTQKTRGTNPKLLFEAVLDR